MLSWALRLWNKRNCVGRREGKTARERLGKLQLGTVVSNIGLGDRLSQCLDRSQDWLLVSTLLLLLNRLQRN